MKRRLRTLVVAAAAALALAAASASAGGPLVGPAVQAAVAGSVFRGFTRTLRGFENHIWRFAPDGTLTAVFNIRKQLGRRGDYYFEGSASGTWSIQGDRLCVQWRPSFYTDSDCYLLVIDESVSVLGGHYIRLIGRETWQGTLQR